MFELMKSVAPIPNPTTPIPRAMIGAIRRTVAPYPGASPWPAIHDHASVSETRGTRSLRGAGVPFTVHTYAHLRKGAEFAAEALGIPLARFAKTLVVEAGDATVFALLPGDRELSLRKLARLAGCKAAVMADPRDAERLTGYQVGGISPFGARRSLPVYVEQHLLEHERIAINAGQRGVIVELATRDVVRVLDAVVADLAS
jgi:Cys-tRNA(Pro)/Cys-tRNA(Cys) deacylase